MGMFVCLCVVRASAAIFFCTPASQHGPAKVCNSEQPRPRHASSPDVYNAYGENMVNVKDNLAYAQPNTAATTNW